MTIEAYTVPRSLEQLTQAVASGNASVFAGGTDLMLQMQSGAGLATSHLVNLNRVDELRGIVESGSSICLGALTTITDILESPLLQNAVPVLVDAAKHFAGGQVRNTATLGGNICNASPAGDMIIPLLVLDAEVELASWKEGKVARRALPLSEFFVGPGRTKLEPQEVLTCVRFREPGKRHVGLFSKFGTRCGMDIAVVSVGLAGIRENGCLRHVRVAYGAVAPTPVRGVRTEAALEGRALDDQCVSTIGPVIEQDISPISDVRASAWYRKQVLRHLTQRLLCHVDRRER